MKIIALFFLGIIIIIYALIRVLILRRREINTKCPKQTIFLKRIGFRKIKKYKRFDGKLINLAKKTFSLYLDPDFLCDLREEDENAPLSDFVIYEQRRNGVLKNFFICNDTAVSCQDIIFFCHQHRSDLAKTHNFFCYLNKGGEKKIAVVISGTILCLEVIGASNDCIFAAGQGNNIFLKDQ